MIRVEEVFMEQLRTFPCTSSVAGVRGGGRRRDDDGAILEIETYRRAARQLCALSYF